MTKPPATTADRVQEYGITLAVVEGPRHAIERRGNARPWSHYAFRVQLTTADGRSMVTDWRQGEAHGKKAPSAADVLGALAVDASSYEEARDLADFADNFYPVNDADELREVQRMYDACHDVFDQLGDVLGEDGRAALLYETERD